MYMTWQCHGGITFYLYKLLHENCSGTEGGTRFLHLQTSKVLPKAGCSSTIKSSVTNDVTQQKQELLKSSIFHKIIFCFSTFILITSREPCCAGFSSEGGRELQYFTFSATAALKSPLQTQSSALMPLLHSWRQVDNLMPSRSHKQSPSGSQRQTYPMSNSGKLNSEGSIINYYFCSLLPYWNKLQHSNSHLR